MQKAVFFDRDGVLLSLVYDTEQTIIRTPISPREVKIMPYAANLLKTTKKLGYKNVVISNQPDIGLERITHTMFQKIQNVIEAQFAKNGIVIDDYYYCFHHPFATFPSYKKICDCRKPKPGLLQDAAKKHAIDLTKSWMIGDGVNDMRAGHTVGCKTILIANLPESGYLSLLEKNLKGIKPDYIVKNLKEIPNILHKKRV